jgi:hypothetical protein
MVRTAYMCSYSLRSNGFAKFGRFLWVDYQITEIYKYTCDDEIREVFTTLPRDLGETFNYVIKRITKRGSAKTASYIF